MRERRTKKQRKHKRRRKTSKRAGGIFDWAYSRDSKQKKEDEVGECLEENKNVSKRQQFDTCCPSKWYKYDTNECKNLKDTVLQEQYPVVKEMAVKYFKEKYPQINSFDAADDFERNNCNSWWKLLKNKKDCTYIYPLRDHFKPLKSNDNLKYRDASVEQSDLTIEDSNVNLGPGLPTNKIEEASDDDSEDDVNLGPDLTTNENDEEAPNENDETSDDDEEDSDIDFRESKSISRPSLINTRASNSNFRNADLTRTTFSRTQGGQRRRRKRTKRRTIRRRR